jgi:hypothetical protein
MAKSDTEVEFTADFENVKKGEVRLFSKDIAYIFINDLKVAKLKEVEVKEVKTKKTK